MKAGIDPTLRHNLLAKDATALGFGLYVWFINLLVSLFSKKKKKETCLSAGE
jgi:hypothetical protein